MLIAIKHKNAQMILSLIFPFISVIASMTRLHAIPFRIPLTPYEKKEKEQKQISRSIGQFLGSKRLHAIIIGTTYRISIIKKNSEVLRNLEQLYIKTLNNQSLPSSI